MLKTVSSITRKLILTKKELFMSMFKKSLAVIFSALLLSAVVGCNTTRGVGEDVEAGGNAIQRSAQ